MGGAGYRDASSAAAAFFSFPQAVATDSSGNVYVADTSNNAIRKITPAGVVTTLAGAGVTGFDEPSFSDGTGIAAKFKTPSGLVMDKNGNLFVVDTGNRSQNYACRCGEHGGR